MKTKKKDRGKSKIKDPALLDKSYYVAAVKAYDKFMQNAFGIIDKIVRGDLILFAGKATGDIYFINREYVKKLEAIGVDENPDRAQEYLEQNGIPYILYTYIIRYIQGFSRMNPYAYIEIKDELMKAIIKNAFIMDKSDGVLSFLKNII